MSGRLMRNADRLIALGLFLAVTLCLGLAQREVGIPRDEGIYFEAAERYWDWFGELGDNLRAGTPRRSFTVGAITRSWNFNTEHPALLKVLFAVSWRIFHRGLGWMSATSAFRFPAWLLSGLGIALVFLIGRRLIGRVGGLAAALLVFTTPHIFFHSQLACFDAPVMALVILVVYGYLRSLTSLRWGLITGVFFGLACATKHNAWFVAPVLLVHSLVVGKPDFSLRPLRLPRVPVVFPAMAIFGPLIFYLHWPWLWFDTMAHLRSYLRFHLDYVLYSVEYLGQNWNRRPLPFTFPFGMTLFSVPTVLLGLAAVGGWLMARAPLAPAAPSGEIRRSWLRPGIGLDPRPGLLFALCAFYPLGLIAMPGTPISGGTKHFMSGWVFFALLAGVPIEALWRWWRASADEGKRSLWLRALPYLLPFVAAMPGTFYTVLTHPFGLSQYNALAGGQAGAADLGLQRQFWGYAPRALLPWMNAHYEPNARVYFHDVIGYSHRAYVRDGILRADIAYSGIERPAIESSSHALVIHERHFNKYEYWIWDTYGTTWPERVLTLGGVPLVTVYGRPGRAVGWPPP